MNDQLLSNTSAEVADDLTDRFLTFNIGDAVYGISLIHVTEIIQIQSITHIPDVPAYVKGIINLRGKVVPVMDVRLKFNQEERAHDDKTCIIVIVVDEMQIGLIVDSVSEVVTIERSKMAAPPDNAGKENSYLESIAEVNGKMIMNIDFNNFFQSDLINI